MKTIFKLCLDNLHFYSEKALKMQKSCECLVTSNFNTVFFDFFNLAAYKFIKFFNILLKYFSKILSE